MGSAARMSWDDIWDTPRLSIALLLILRYFNADITAYHVPYFLRNELSPSCLDGIVVVIKQKLAGTTSLDFEK